MLLLLLVFGVLVVVERKRAHVVVVGDVVYDKVEVVVGVVIGVVVGTTT